MRCRLSWLALPGPAGALRTVGVLGAGGGAVDFLALPAFPSAQETVRLDLLQAAALGGDAIFERYVEGANGITRELSDPFEVTAPTLSAALAHAVGSIPG